MTPTIEISFQDASIDQIDALSGTLVLMVPDDCKLDRLARRADRLSKGAVKKAVGSDEFAALSAGHVMLAGVMVGLAARKVVLLKLDKNASATDARRAGARLAAAVASGDLAVLAGSFKHADQLSYGLALRAYKFTDRKSGDTDSTGRKAVFLVADPEKTSAAAQPMAALAESVFFTRDLTNDPANILTTDEFAARLAAMGELGIEIDILEEDDLKKLKMDAFLAVGFGSATPTKMVVMRWNAKPGDDVGLLVGKGVVFDTGGISLKPPGGMEAMTGDMGGAGVVSGVMRGLALRNSPASVVGIVGLVENMPGSRAQRPGDIVTSMKGDTIEVINTDAEGRLVLADVMWYAQQTYKPKFMIDLATLTGAMVMALGHENAGYFSNDDDLSKALNKAAEQEDEGAWRLPLGQGYADQLKSNLADVKNVGGRPAGAITAAEFLQRFVKPETAWVHIDIAGVSSQAKNTIYATKGASGWGVRTLDRLIRNELE